MCQNTNHVPHISISRLQMLEQNFFPPFYMASKELSEEEQSILKSIKPTMFNKWCYSAFVPNTAITPSNLVNGFMAGDGCVNVLKPKYDMVQNGESLAVICNSSQYHSIVHDLVVAANYFAPANKRIDYSLYPHLIDEYFIKKGILDPFYLNYLILILINLELVQKLPSINAQIYQKADDACADFFAKSHKEIINCLADCVFTLFEENMCVILETENLLSREEILEVFARSNSADDLFVYLYRNLGFEFADMVQMADSDELSGDDENLLSSVYYMGTLMDKWLFTPLGTYLNLIIPVYVERHDMQNEMDFIRPLLLTGCDMSSELFASCNYFYLTPLGEEIFGIENPEEEFSLKYISFTDNQLAALLESQRTQTEPREPETLMKLNIIVAGADNLWKILEIPDTFNLDQLYEAIVYFFGLHKDAYRFKLKKNKKRLVRQFLKMTACALKDIDLEDNRLILETGGEIYEITLLEKYMKTGGNSARLLRQSTEITLLERNDEY